MPVEKFRSLEQMNQAHDLPPPASDRELLRRIAVVWRRAARLAPTLPFSPGVEKYHDLEEAQRARAGARAAASVAVPNP